VPGALDRVNARFAETRGRPASGEQRGSIDQWISEYLLPSGMANQFVFGGHAYGFGSATPNVTWGTSKAREFSSDLPGHAAAVKACPPAFAAELVRALVLSQARFTFRNVRWSKTPRRMFGTQALSLLERPWPNGTTGDLIGKMEWHAGLAGNSFVTNWQQRNRLRVLRPDWTAIVYGSQSEPDDPAGALDGEVLGYVYQNGGIKPGNQNQMQTLPVSSVAHWAPLPDPLNAGLGMSWITPALREIQGDMLTSQHKITYFSNGATPNMVVKGIPAVTREQFDEIVDAMEDRHAGIANAYRTLYLTAGADATVVGSNMAELDFRGIQAGGETRIAFLSRVPAPLLGISEGLAGSSLNAGNFSAARRMFADSWIFPTLQNLASTVAPLVTVPGDAELWFDTADMPILREDAKDAADIEQVKSSTITAYVKEGFTPESAVAAVSGQDITLLRHTGLTSVQLWAPGLEGPRKLGPGAESPVHPTGPPPPAKGAPAPPAQSGSDQAGGTGGAGNG
jgi:phage portal protein BeeE